MFYFKAQSVEANDLDAIQTDVGAHQYNAAAGGMHDQHEAHLAPRRTPHQITDSVADAHLLLSVDGTLGLLEGSGILEQRLEFDLLAVESRPASSSRTRSRGSRVGGRIALGTADQVVAVAQHRGDDLASGVVGVGDEVV